MVFGLWLGTLGASLIYNARRGDITRAQKVINSRLVAQVSVLGGMGLLAATGVIFPETNTKPAQAERIY